VAVVIASAVIPTLIAGIAFLPRHLLLQPDACGQAPENSLKEEG